MTKKQIWVLIAIVAIGVIALVSDIQIKVEVGTENYTNYDECYFKEITKSCNEGNKGSDGNECLSATHSYCQDFLGLPMFPDEEDND